MVETKKDIWTIKRILEWTSSYLKSKGCGTPRLDAEALLAHCLSVSRVELYLNFDTPLTISEREAYRNLVLRRACREPVALIIGQKEFWSLPFKVKRGVLIPRPDSETLVEVAVQELRHLKEPLALDIGVGSGAISLSILKEVPCANIVGVDISKAAIELSINNAHNLGFGDSFLPLLTDMTSCFKSGPIFDMILSNPPYIPSAEVPALSPEIVNFEPISALDGGTDGLDFIRTIANESHKHLSESGSLALEIGEGQFEAVSEILNLSGFYRAPVPYRDLSGKIRVVKALLS